MTFAMPSPDLLQAVRRLDQAISRAEANLDTFGSAPSTSADDPRDAIVREAIAELNQIIGTLQKNEHG